MFVVSDTSVISNLAIIGRLEILKNLHESVVIPKVVRLELNELENPDAEAQILQGIAEGWLEIAELTGEELEYAETLQLHAGEAHAITIAKHRKARLLCIDEKNGRAVAESLNIPTRGLLGFLLDEKLAGRLDAVKPCLEELDQKARFFMTKSLVSRVLELAGE